MSVSMPEQGIAVDPQAVTAQLRQQHAQQTDTLQYELAQMTVACRDLQAQVGELRIKAEELANDNTRLRARVAELEQAQSAEKSATRKP